MAEKPKTYTYTVILLSEKRGGFSVFIPALGCATQGDNILHALDMARECAECYIEALMMDGEPVPKEGKKISFRRYGASEGFIFRVTARPEVPPDRGGG